MAACGVGTIREPNGRPTAPTLDRLLTRLGVFERRVLHAFVARQHTARDPNEAFDAQATFGDRLADGVARFGGSWTFIGLFGVILVSWMAYNEGTARPFDPFPFILLNLLLSCVAALQAPVIMMSQNRQSAKDRSDARADYEVNVRAEVEVMALHAKLDLLREQDWARLIALVERQQRAIERARAAAGRPRDARHLESYDRPMLSRRDVLHALTAGAAWPAFGSADSNAQTGDASASCGHRSHVCRHGMSMVPAWDVPHGQPWRRTASARRRGAGERALYPRLLDGGP